MTLFRYLKKVFEEFSADKGSQLAAALAYTGIFATVPFLVVIVSFASLVFGQQAAEGTLFANIQYAVGNDTAQTLQKAIIHTNQIGHSLLALIIGIGLSLLAASALASQLQSALDHIFDIRPKKGGWKHYIYVKLRNIALIILASIVIVVSVAATALLSAIGGGIAEHFGRSSDFLQAVNLLASFGVFVFFLYLIYRMVPDTNLPRRIVFWASLVIGLMFMLGKVILGWVIGHNAATSAYGTAASLITLLLWFYYTGQILLLGAESIKIYSKTHRLQYGPKQK